MAKKGPAKPSKPSASSSATTKKPQNQAADDSFIVFTNSDKDPKPKKTKTTAPGASSATAADDGVKRPTVKQIIGGASWTGKLPVNLLSEHCQKQKWMNPEYTMVCSELRVELASHNLQSKTADGHSSMVILKMKNPKTQELMTLPPFRLPPTLKHLAVRPTPLEARHFAATYGLFRVCSMRNIHMSLPPDYRDLWKGDFETLKKADVKEGRAWMYEADPFAAQKAREDAKAAAEKKAEEQAKAKAKIANAPGGAGVNLSIRGRDGASGGGYMKSWTNVPKVDMDKRIRARVESLVQRYTVWNPHGVKLSDADCKKILSELQSLGFRESHIQEALTECKDREETLEWLLIHVPEDDLPRWALPEGYTSGISMASSDLKKEGMINRLAKAGYSTELCKKTLDECQGDEARTAEKLQSILMSSDPNANSAATLLETPVEASAELWKEELASLESVYGDQFTQPTQDVCRIELTPAEGSLKKTLKPTVQIQRTSRYPHEPPVVFFFASLPTYIRLSVMKKALLHATETLLGDPMIFFLVDWIEQNLQEVVEHPGKLRDVSAAASTVGDAPVLRPRPKRAPKHPPRLRWTPNQKSRDDWSKRQSESRMQSRLKERGSLPAWEVRHDLVDIVNTHQVTIISGETGSGKSTQSAQFILDDMYERCFGEAAKILCTQPRRISALGLADRVSDERCSTVGQEVGYIIRGESRVSQNTKIIFMTTGVLLRRLQTSGGSSDDVVASLADISHIIIDEVHERSLDTDFLLVLLRDVLTKRDDLKLILMSATLDAGIFEAYFRGQGKVGRVEISGRTYPVEDFYLDDVVQMTGFNSRKRADTDEAGDEADTAAMIRSVGMRINYDLIAATVREIDAELSYNNQDGGILIFLPGTMEINRTLDSLRSIPKLHALPLHASLLSSEQRRVFPHAPAGKRKVIAATNVAETSITIDDIVAVIDTGRVKETSYDPQNNLRKLEEVWASQAACKQRRGRAGRVQAGKCYKLYTRKAEEAMSARPDPEMRRVPLEQLCLSVRAMGIRDVAGFLASALTPPETLAVDGALALLRRMGALDGEDLTALGRHLSMIPADLRCGKLMVYGSIFGCLDSCVTIAGILTVKSPFVAPQDKRDESKARRAVFAQGQGDLVADLHAYEEWHEMLKSKSISPREIRAWCSENFLSYQTLTDISSNRTQFLASLREIGFLPARNLDVFNRYNDNAPLIRSLVAGAFNPQLARIAFPEKKFAASMSGAVELDPEARTIKYFNQENGRVFVHPSSTMFDAQGFPGSSVFMSYFSKITTSKVFIRDLTPFNAYTALLLSGPIALDTRGRGLVVDGWLHFRGWARIGVLVSRLRSMLDEVLVRKIDDPATDLDNDEVVLAVKKLIELDGLDQ